MIDFSIVIPTYNRAGFITEAIDSVLEQTHKSFEIIVIDDGSTDNTADVIKNKYASESKLSYVYQTNAERGAARNHGISLAKGNYIVFLDSDDSFSSTHLAILKEAIDLHPSCSFFATKYSFYFNDHPHTLYPSDLSKYQEGFYQMEIVLHGNPLACNFCVKVKSGFVLFPEDRKISAMEDWVFLIVNLVNTPIYLINEQTVFMREHAQRSMRAEYENLIQKRLDALSFIEKTIHLTERQQKEIEAYSFYFCSIHAFVGNDKEASVQFIRKAVSLVGWRKEFLLLRTKILLGGKFVKLLKRVIR